MATIDFPDVFDKLKKEVVELALSSIKKFRNEAKEDGLKLLEDMKTNLEKWTALFAEGRLSKQDIEFLVLAQKEIIVMNALKQAGCAKITINKFIRDLLNTVIKTVLSII